MYTNYILHKIFIFFSFNPKQKHLSAQQQQQIQSIFIFKAIFIVSKIKFNVCNNVINQESRKSTLQ